MTDSAAVQLDELKPHLQATFDEARRAGLEACREIHHQVKASLPEELRLEFDRGNPDCAHFHLLAAVAFDLSKEKSIAGEDDAIDWLLEGVQMSQKADECEQGSS
jgi:hypothetical protein